MRKFRYIGDPRDHARKSPEHDEEGRETVVFGYAFVLNGKPVTVDDPVVEAKLEGNNHFEEVVSKRKKSRVKK